jgi:hypothetical protein
MKRSGALISNMNIRIVRCTMSCVAVRRASPAIFREARRPPIVDVN